MDKKIWEILLIRLKREFAEFNKALEDLFSVVKEELKKRD